MESGETVATVDTGAASPAESSVSTPSADALIDAAFNAPDPVEAQGNEEPAEDAQDATTEESPEPTEVEAKDAAEGESEEEADPFEERLAEISLPPNWKEALKAMPPDVAKAVRAEHYQLQQYKEVIPLDQARELRFMFPTAEEAKQAHEARADLMALVSSLRSNPNGFIGYIAQNYPDSFAEIKARWPQWLHDSNPEEYRESYAKPMIGTFLSHWAENGDELQQEAAKILMQADQAWSQRNRPAPEDHLVRRNQELERREFDRQQQSIRSFNADLDRDYQGKAREAIAAVIDRAGATALTKDAKAEIVQKTMVMIAERLRSDRTIATALTQSIREGTRDAEQQKQLVGWLLQRVKPMIGPFVKESLGGLSKMVVRGNQERHDKEQKVPTRKPIVAGAPPGQRQDKVDLSKMSLADKRRLGSEKIIDMVARGQAF